MSQECTAPDRLCFGHRPRDQLSRKASYWPTSAVEQTGLAGQNVTLFDYANLVSAGSAQAVGSDHGKVAFNTEQVFEVFANSTC
jgi:hypothetical protein